MKIHFEDQEKARKALADGRVDEAAAHATRQFDFLFRLLFHIDITDASPQRFERRFNKIPESYRPPRNLLKRLMVLRSLAAGNQKELVEAEVKEFVSGMDQVIRLADEADTPYD